MVISVSVPTQDQSRVSATDEEKHIKMLSQKALSVKLSLQALVSQCDWKTANLERISSADIATDSSHPSADNDFRYDKAKDICEKSGR